MSGRTTNPADVRPRDRGRTILLGEDEAAVRRLATTILEKDGYTVVGAADGWVVLELFRTERERVDLVILDQHMPGPGVRATLGSLEVLNPSVRVLLISGAEPSESTPEPRANVRGFLAKPFRGGELLRAVESALAECR